MENRDKLQPDDTLLREGWRAVYELGEEVCYANVVRSLAIALDMSDKPDFMDGMDEAFVQMELEMFQRIADAAG
ncbi:MAG: hypothetical protein HZA95_02150 [Candidatus Vogelbacteria bacterium]|nr:hypothetical protein [Candidatus Vogelbacteria bacterium]